MKNFKGKQDHRFDAVCKAARRQMARMKIPGLAVGVLHNGRLRASGFGVTSIDNTVPVTGETLFQIASISKTFLCTAVMRLVDAGKLNLDAPLRRYLPDLKLKDKEVARNVTMRHLLTHTGGWHGDYFNDFGAGDDAVRKMVKAMADLPQVVPLGNLWSYNNSGFYLAAGVIEAVTDRPFETAVKELVFEPLGLKKTFYSAREVMTHSFALGHHVIKKKVRIARPYGQGRATSPAGGIITNLKDLLSYARFHMGDGSWNGKKMISAKRFEQMHSPLFPANAEREMALSWFVTRPGGHTALSHTGSINGQMSSLTLIPKLNFAMAVFTNSDYGGEVCAEITKAALKEYFNIPPLEMKSIRLPKKGLSEYRARFEMPVMTCDVVVEGKGLTLKMVDKGGYPTPSSPPLDQPPPVPVKFYAEDKIMGFKSPYKTLRGEFLRDPRGEIKWLRLFSRIFPRVARGRK